MDPETRNKLYASTVKSKNILNFGYGAHCRMDYYKCVMNSCFCCCKRDDEKRRAASKFSSANKNLKRGGIGRAKKA